MQATIHDLTMVLFEMVERIDDDELKGDELREQINKAIAINKISETILKAGDLQVKAMKLNSENQQEIPKYLTDATTTA